MKKILLGILFFIFKILYYFFIQLFLPQKVLMFGHGWDTLNPFSPYSYGGVPRKKFLVYFRKMNKGTKISSDEYIRAKWGSLIPSKEEFLKVCELEETTRKNYSFRN
ncbi:MAG TPA: hypothetical protein VIK86_05305 [Candidatus Paceibacterota bacterium]